MDWVAGGGVIKKKIGVRKARWGIQCILWSLKGCQLMSMALKSITCGLCCADRENFPDENRSNYIAISHQD
jgi:hypothetical protein